MSWHDANYICSYCLLVPTRGPRGSELADGITFFFIQKVWLPPKPSWISLEFFSFEKVPSPETNILPSKMMVGGRTILPFWGVWLIFSAYVSFREGNLPCCTYRDCTADFREYNQPFFSRIFGSLWTVRRISWNVRVLLPLLLPLLWSQEMLEEGNVSIMEYGQELPSDTTTETPETPVKTTVSTTQRVPWKVQAGPRSNGWKMKVWFEWLFVVKRTL